MIPGKESRNQYIVGNALMLYLVEETFNQPHGVEKLKTQIMGKQPKGLAHMGVKRQV